MPKTNNQWCSVFILFQTYVQAISNNIFHQWKKKFSASCEIQKLQIHDGNSASVNPIWFKHVHKSFLRQTCLAFRNKQSRMQYFRIPFHYHLIGNIKDSLSTTMQCARLFMFRFLWRENVVIKWLDLSPLAAKKGNKGVHFVRCIRFVNGKS